MRWGRYLSQKTGRRRDDRDALGELLAIAERDLKKSQAAFAETARLIDPKRTPVEVLKVVESDHPPAEAARDDAGELDALGRFMTEKRIITIPKAAPARVEETPPFMRATTTASMDIRDRSKSCNRGVLHDAARSESVGGGEK